VCLRKDGLRRQAHLVQCEFIKGEWTDELIYAILRSEGAARQSPGNVTRPEGWVTLPAGRHRPFLPSAGAGRRAGCALAHWRCAGLGGKACSSPSTQSAPSGC
jgi:hypothetical protein